MTEIAHHRRKTTSIKRQLYLMVAAFAAISIALVQFQFWQSTDQEDARNDFVEYHIASLLALERINAELFNFQTICLAVASKAR